MVERGQFLPPPGQHQPGTDVGDAEQEDRDDHGRHVDRDPSQRQQHRARDPAQDPARSPAAMPAHRVQQCPDHPAEGEAGPDLTGRGRLAQQPLGEEGAKDLAQIVEVEQHQAHDDDQQIPVRDEVLQAGHRADLECQPIARG